METNRILLETQGVHVAVAGVMVDGEGGAAFRKFQRRLLDGVEDEQSREERRRQGIAYARQRGILPASTPTPSPS
ncbi:MAG: hypothetical protein ABQ298_03790 [Puniceicoccaceae bacterium]